MSGAGRRTRSAKRRAAALAAAVIGAIALTSCAGAGGASSTAAPSATDVSREHERVAAAVDAALAETGIPGAAVELSDGDGATWTHVSGMADVAGKVPVTTDTLFGYRSITKSFTVSIVLQLVDEQAVALDAPVGTYVPGVPSGDRITIRELAGMRSGLANYSATPPIQAALQADITTTFTDDEMLAAAFAEPLDFEPGTSYEYSNTNTILLGQVIESVTGRPWQDEVSKRLLDPLGLHSVSYPGAGAMPEGMALPYEANGSGQAPEAIPVLSASALSAAGGLVGTIEDLGRWARALGAASFLDPQTAGDRMSKGTASSTASDPKSPYYNAYGLGMGTLDGWIGHTGVGLGFQAFAMSDPTSGRSIAILLNGTGADPDAPAHLFEKLLPLLADG